MDLDRELFPSRLLGVFPLDTRYVFSWRWFGVTVFNFGVFFFLGSWTLMTTIYDEDPEYTRTLRYLDRLDWTLMTSGAVLCFLEVLLSRDGFKRLMLETGNTERTVRRSGIPESRSKPSEMRSLCIISTLLGVVVVIYLYKQTWDSFAPFYVLGFLMIDRIRSQPTALLLQQQNHLQSLLLHLTNRHPQKSSRILTLAILQHAICSTSAKINSLYSLTMLLHVSLNFFFLVTAGYYLLFIQDEILSANFLGEFWWIFIHLYELWCLVSCCVSTKNKVKEFNTNLYQITMDDFTDELANNGKIQLCVNMKMEITFTACGLFNLDYTLFHSMIATATTYLVILVQIAPLSSHEIKIYTTNSTILLNN